MFQQQFYNIFNASLFLRMENKIIYVKMRPISPI